MGITLPNNGIYTDGALYENWKAIQDAEQRVIDARLFGHWAIDYATSDEGVDTLGYRGGLVKSAAGAWSVIADGTVTLTDNATNYVERTLAGVVSANAVGFTTGRLPMYTVVVTAHVFTAITDYRQFAAQLETILLAIAQLTPAADKGVYFTSGTAAALFDLSAFARTLLDDADAATMRATLGIQALIDAAIAGLDQKASVRVKTTANVNLATDLENGDTIDGVVLATGDRVLVGSQTAPAENGIYVVPASGAASRATDADAWTELVAAFVVVEEGTANADTFWLCTVNAGGTLGVTAVNFAQFGGGTVLSTGITDSSAAGRALLTASDAEAQRNLLNVGYYTIPFTIGDGTNPISAGVWSDYHIDIAGEIVEVVVLAVKGGAGSIVVDLYKCTYADYDGGATHPVVGDSITASAKPTLSSATKSKDATLTGWTKALALADVLRAYVDSASTVTLVYLGIKVKRT
jgi:hypothetical protein